MWRQKLLEFMLTLITLAWRELRVPNEIDLQLGCMMRALRVKICRKYS